MPRDNITDHKFKIQKSWIYKLRSKTLYWICLLFGSIQTSSSNSFRDLSVHRFPRSRRSSGFPRSQRSSGISEISAFIRTTRDLSVHPDGHYSTSNRYSNFVFIFYLNLKCSTQKWLVWYLQFLIDILFLWH